MHQTQLDILKKLLFVQSSRFSDLKPAEMENKLFIFHLDKLIEANLVVKDVEGQYSLSEEGKSQANAIDFDANFAVKQAKQSAVFCATRNNGTEILLYTRLKSPFYGRQGFPTGKVRYSEKISETASRELKEETNLEGEAKLLGIRHFRVYYPNPDTIVEDKVMYFHRIDDPTGELISNSEGDFYWVKLSEIEQKITNPLPEFQFFLEILKTFNGEITFAEIEQYPDSF